MEVAKPWLYLKDVVVGLSTYLEDFRTHLLHVVRPEWRGKELDVKVFDSGITNTLVSPIPWYHQYLGITNTLVALYLKEKGLASSGGEVVLLRMNGTGSEKIIDRSDELNSMQLLHKAGLGPPIHAQLSNGLCYGFLPGRQMDLEEVRSEGEYENKFLYSGNVQALHSTPTFTPTLSSSQKFFLVIPQLTMSLHLPSPIFLTLAQTCGFLFWKYSGISTAVWLLLFFVFICLYVYLLFFFSCEVQISLRNTFNTLDAARLFESPPTKPNCLRVHQP